MRRFLFAFVMAMCCVTLFAQQPGWGQHPNGGRQGKGGNNNMPNIEKFLEDRITFVTRAMNLSAADSVKFVPIYKEKLKKKGDLMMNSRPHHIIPGQEYPDSVYTSAAMAETNYKLEDAKIDMEYLKKFQKILKPQQVYMYLQSEKMFVGSFMHPGGPRKQGQK